MQTAVLNGKKAALKHILAILYLRGTLPKIPAAAQSPLARFVRSAVAFHRRLIKLEHELDVSKDVRRELVAALEEFQASDEALAASWQHLVEHKESAVWRERFKAAYELSSKIPLDETEARQKFDAWVDESVEK